MDKSRGCIRGPSAFQRHTEAAAKRDKIVAESCKQETKALHNALLTRLHTERKEAEMETSCTRAKESQGWRAEEVKQEDRLAREMAKDKLKDINDMKLRDYLKNSDELKELQKKIQRAYAQRELAAQLMEKKAAALKKKCQENEELKLINDQEKMSEEFDRSLREKEFLRKMQYKEELQDQLIDRQKLKEMEYRKQLEEKAILEESLKTILEEDKKEEELKQYKKQKSKEDTDAMLRAKQTWMKFEKEYQEEQNRKIRDYLEEKAQKERELQEETRRREELKMKQRLACMEKIKSNEAERQERERIAQILMNEDSRLKEEDRLKKEKDKRLRTYLEQKEITALQIGYQMKAKEKQKMEDLKFLQTLMEENARELKQEEEQMMKKKLESIEHGKQLRELIEEQNLQKIKEMERNYLDETKRVEALKQRQQLLAEERLKLLKEHARNLVGFLPKGVILEEDLQYLDPEVQEFYKKV